MAISITTKASRARLEPRGAPYYMQLGTGAFIGFRRGPDTWVARYRDRRGQQHHETLGEFPEFDDAKAAADAWFKKLDGGGSRKVTRGTVRDALDTYLRQLISDGRGTAAARAEKKFETVIYHDEIAIMSLEETTKEDWQDWRARVQKQRKLANASVMRYCRSVFAAMTCAVDKGHVGNPLSWKLNALPSPKAEAGETAVYLTEKQSARLLRNSPSTLRDFLHAIYVSGGRPQEIAAATVADYDVKVNTLVLRHYKGRPAILRARVVSLNKKDAPFFRKLCEGKTPGAPLVADDKGAQYGSHKWALEFRAAVTFANFNAKPDEIIPTEDKKKKQAGASAYSFRHMRISEMLQRFNIDAMTVAEQTGTSVKMMEDYYWKFMPKELQAKFDRTRAAA